MLKNYLKLAWRNILKNRFYSIVNILGLSVGIAFTLLVAGYIWAEVQVNRNLRNADNQYTLDITIGELPRALKENFPEQVVNYYRWDGIGTIVSRGDKHFTENLQIGDTTLLSMFGFKLMHGNASAAFKDPFNVVITPKVALKYFGTTDVVGQTLTIANFNGQTHPFTVGGVLDNLPKNSVTDMFVDGRGDIFMSTGATQFMERTTNGWNNPNIASYIELKPGVDPKFFDIPMQKLIKKNSDPQIAATARPYLIPLKSYYLNGTKRMLYTLSYVGLFILLMAVINYVNMCVSRSSNRLKEMGIRKVLGGMRGQLIRQFLAESVVLVLISTVVALIFYLIARPFFSNMLNSEMVGFFSYPWYIYLIPFSFAILVGLLAGIYPALVLTALRSVDALKGKLATVNEKVFVRKSLVAFQFGTALVVLSSALVISQQISLFFGKDLGYNKDLLIYAKPPRYWSGEGVMKMEAIRDRLIQSPDISDLTLSYSISDGRVYGSVNVFKHGADSTKAIAVDPIVCDGHYASTYGIKLVAGTFLNATYKQGDELRVVINQSQAKALGWSDPKKAVGQQIRVTEYQSVLTICGVTADHQFGSMQAVTPSIIFVNQRYVNLYRYFTIKLRTGNLQQRIASVQKLWDWEMPGTPFEYQFIDDALAKMYREELRLQKAAYTATVLAVIIVLLGVIGLVSQSVQKRTKEIGIRKVLGSSAMGISSLFLKDILTVVAIAGVLACPIAWALMHNWLADYAKKITLSPGPFLLAVAGLSLLTGGIIILQTIKVALSRPADSLRSE
ncbi:ABC transporter permease [Mucilaginibacter myungsuensis]|uniref:ABC transporter permease n=1 Tax=Mucilaginibacter myungsuensis TaxID=649104 RepID=A0A929PVN8_9SPHI|nr:ABC transporter permease [Mucilaginibacter myungsuensis]MBE9661324.1 ABC transporter permease [Mucilaginibacter myungsuensis]MDN3597467.1 ABC transporter permease [Mucilaginibacter myungsuensis]